MSVLVALIIWSAGYLCGVGFGWCLHQQQRRGSDAGADS